MIGYDNDFCSLARPKTGRKSAVNHREAVGNCFNTGRFLLDTNIAPKAPKNKYTREERI
jgi:hypothetical protein